MQQQQRRVLVLTTLRNTALLVPEYRNPLARFSFRTVYADSANKGRFSQKHLGMVYSCDILGEPGALHVTARRLHEDADEVREPTNRECERKDRTLDELRFVPGDYLLVAVLLPKSVTVPTEISIKGSAEAGAAPINGWRSGPGGPPGCSDGGWGGSTGPSAGVMHPLRGPGVIRVMVLADAVGVVVGALAPVHCPFTQPTPTTE